jgi:peptidoglycan-associated lipoprotein
MRSSRFRTLAAAIFALAASAPLSAQTSAGTRPRDDVLGTYLTELRLQPHFRAAPAPETGMVETPPADTAAVAAAPDQDALDAATRARADSVRADSVEQARLAAADAMNHARADSVEQASADSVEQANAALRDELAGPIHFDFDRSGIQPGDKAVLDRKAAILTANPALRIRIAGYCDERGSDEYNLALGDRRAAAAKQYLIERGIEASRLDVVSYGSASPVDSGQTEAAWALNRRAGFEVVSGTDALTAPVTLR